MTVSPPRTRWPFVTASSHSGGTKTSIREPNFIRPMRSPVASRWPTPVRVTIRRARTPTICRKTTVRTSGPSASRSTSSLRSLRCADSRRYAARKLPGRYELSTTSPR